MLARATVTGKLVSLRAKYPRWQQAQMNVIGKSQSVIESFIDRISRYDDSLALGMFMEVFSCSIEEWESAEREIMDFCGCTGFCVLDDRLIMIRLLNQWLETAKAEHGDCTIETEYIQLVLLADTEDMLRQANHAAFIMLCGALACLLLCMTVLAIVIRVFEIEIRKALYSSWIVVVVVVLIAVFSRIVYGKTEKSLEKFLAQVGHDDP